MAAPKHTPAVPGCLGSTCLRLDADAPSGLSWLEGMHGARTGFAGSLVNGQYVVKVQGVQYRCYAIVYALSAGAAPTGPLMPLDGDWLNCTPGNIRLQDGPRSARAAARAQQATKAKVAKPSTLAERIAANRRAYAAKKAKR